MGTLFTVAGIAITTELASKVVEYFGHGDKIVFLKIIGYIACGIIAIDFWLDGVEYVKSVFGVRF